MYSHYETLIIGGGPAGLQMGYFLQKNGRDYMILERADRPGNFFHKFPRHRKLISINKVHTARDPEASLRWDWNSLLSDDPQMRFTRYATTYFPNPDVLVKYMQDFADHFQLKLTLNTDITKIDKVDGQFMVMASDGRVFTSRVLILATGFTKEIIPDFPGAELCETYATHDTNPERYMDKRVLIVGKGNSAFETADHLIESAAVIHVLSPTSIKMAWETHYVGNLRAVNNNFLDTYQLKSQNTVIDATITNVRKDGEQYIVDIAYTHAKGQTRTLRYDHVILCTGFRMDASLFAEGIRPTLTIKDKFPEQTHEWESTNVPGMYIAGTLMHACDFRKTMSGFIHGFRHNVKFLAEVLEKKYHNQPLPYESLPVETETILDKVLDRLNNGPGVFLQPGFLNDAIVIENGQARYYQDVRKQYIADDPEFKMADHLYTISLEYGHYEGSVFAIDRDPDPMAAESAAYLHPVIRRFHKGELVNSHHIQDDLENEWLTEEYIGPARAYFAAQLGERAMA